MDLPESRPKPFGMHGAAITARHEIPGGLYLQTAQACGALEGAEVAHKPLLDVVRKRFVVCQAKDRLVLIFAITVRIKQHERRVSLAMWRVNDAEITDERDEWPVNFFLQIHAGIFSGPVDGSRIDWCACHVIVPFDETKC